MGLVSAHCADVLVFLEDCRRVLRFFGDFRHLIDCLLNLVESYQKSSFQEKMKNWQNGKEGRSVDAKSGLGWDMLLLGGRLRKCSC